MPMDLSTRYLGLDLRSPLVASSGPLTARTDTLRALEDAGDRGGRAALAVRGADRALRAGHAPCSTRWAWTTTARPRATSPTFPAWRPSSSGRCATSRRPSARVAVPVIASLNGTSLGGWTRYARQLADAGADALELNLYRVAADATISGAQVEAEQLELVRDVASSVAIPVAVKVGPFYSALAHQARRLVAAGAAGLVLFNRFYQPDLDPLTRRVVPTIHLSEPSEVRLPLRWIGLLSGRLACDLAASTGIHSGLDAAKVLLAGADVAMMTSALLLHGPAHVATVEAELQAWGDEGGYASVAQLRGSASQRHLPDPEAFERANYLNTLTGWTDRVPRPFPQRYVIRRPVTDVAAMRT